ncbi:TetR/AcrR family transcriptional regulator [Weissella paramesenteroides]|uniref:TetR/AcrR family transcriptional regulator n=1 Tax=Weissella paramesenteroides TaxID=1249 RepID=UPI003B97C93B
MENPLKKNFDLTDVLAATLELDEQIKYEDLMMDIIAKHAHTNKSVLYRRWDSKYEIVAAAIQTQSDCLFSIFQQVIDTVLLEGTCENCLVISLLFS